MLHGVDLSQEKIISLIKIPDTASEQATIISAIQKIVPGLQEKGYLAASIDSIGVEGPVYHAYIFTGLQYKWAKVSFRSLPPALFATAGINPLQFEGRPLAPTTLSNLSEKILTWSENNGFPFARVSLDSLIITETGGVSGNMVLDKGTIRKLDSVKIHGRVNISKTYLLHYLSIREGEPYNEGKLRTISNRLRELSFVQEDKPWAIYFKTNDTRLHFYLKEKPANQLNAVIGLQPNSQQTGKFQLTIDGLVALQNTLGFGESFTLTAQKLQYASTMIKADLVWPYLFNTPVGAEAHFDLYNKDTTFRRSSFQLGGRYQFSATDYIRLYYEGRSNRNITPDLAIVQLKKELPDNIDANANGGGAEIVVNRTDYRLNPRKGWQIRVAANALVRKTFKSDAITGLVDGTGYDYGRLYDSLDDNSYQYRMTADASYYLPLGKKATFKTSYFGGYISGQKVFLNELYQVGGFKTLRGFDEESLFTNHYHIISLEVRLLLSATSNVYAFSDNGWVQSKFNESNTSAFYNGFGVGTSLQTKSGVFTIAYALGRSDDIPLKFRQSKIHFGYVAFF